MSARAVFLDRDGTLIINIPYLDTPEGVMLLPGAQPALDLLRGADYKLVLVTNQSGIARGYYDLNTLDAIHLRLEQELEAIGHCLDLIQYCPHHEEGSISKYAKTCECRKPAAGMLVTAAADLDIDLSRSFMIGDSSVDIAAGKAAGCKTIFVPSDEAPDPGADWTSPDLLGAAQWIIEQG